MDFATFVRKPFMVEAVEITEENIEELAPQIGTFRRKEDGSPFINADRRLFPSLYRVYPGFWLTRMGDNVRCYSRTVFKRQFLESNPEIEAWYQQFEKHNNGTS